MRTEVKWELQNYNTKEEDKIIHTNVKWDYVLKPKNIFQYILEKQHFVLMVTYLSVNPTDSLFFHQLSLYQLSIV